MKRWIALSLLGTMLATAPAAAQTAAPPAATASNEGAFDNLSPGNQKIARALFEAQQSGAASKPLAMDRIAAMKQSGKGWGEVFREMKAQGLVQEKNLGQVVSKYSAKPKTQITTGSGRTHVIGGKGKPEGSASAGKSLKGNEGDGTGAGAAVGGRSHGNAYGRRAAESGGQGRFGGNPGHGGGRGR
jgi:hypothetical protein